MSQGECVKHRSEHFLVAPRPVAALGLGLLLLAAACQPTAAPTATTAPAKPAAPAATQAPSGAPSPVAKSAASPAPKAAASPAAASASPAAKPAAKPVNKEEAAKVFQGKSIELIVPYAPGGGYDTYARVFAEFFPKRAPGSPGVVVKNSPGANGLTGVQQGMRAKPDGLTMVLVPQNLIVQELLGKDLAGFDPKTAMYLGTPDAAPTTLVMFVRREVGESWDQIVSSGKQLTFGAPGPGNSQGIPAAWVEMTSGPVRMVFGYGGSAEVWAAVDRGEVDGFVSTNIERTWKQFPEWAAKDYLRPVLRFGKPLDQATLDVGQGKWTQPPEALEVVKSTPIQREAQTLSRELLTGLRVFSLPPNTPENTYLALKQAFEETVKDPGFAAAIEQRGYELGLLTAEDMVTLHQRVSTAPPETREILSVLFATK